MKIMASFPYFSTTSLNDILFDINEVLKSGRLTDGPNVVKFEGEFAEYNDVKFAIAVNSGTSALEIALRHFQLHGKEVIVPTNTFVSTPNAVLFAGGKPVFADMNAETLSVDIEDVKRKITSKTAGVIVVHIAGMICPQINELLQLCKDNDLFLVEDCAHAHGATINGKKAGTFGDAGCFSFYPTKVMTTCEGGMIITNNSKLAEEARCLRTCGQNSERKMVMLGHNWRMNEVQAIIGRHQLSNLEGFLAKRNAVADWYNEVLSRVEGISLFKKSANLRHSYYKYPVKLVDGIDRIELSALLKNKYGIETGHVYYPPCHLHPFYMHTFGTKEGELPISERVLKQVLCLPIHCDITKENISYISESLVLAMNTLAQ